MTSFEKLMASTDKKIAKRSKTFNKKIAKVSKKKTARKTKGKWDEFDEKLWDV